MKSITERMSQKMHKKIKKMSDEEIKILINDMLSENGSGMFFPESTKKKVVEIAQTELESR